MVQPDRDPLTIDTSRPYVSDSFSSDSYETRATTDLVVCASQDPSDPTTYPNQEHVSVSNRRFRVDTTRDLQPNRPSYRGLPEVC